jgi:hypothetical protein
MRFTRVILFTFLILVVSGISMFISACRVEDPIIDDTILRPDNFPETTVDEEEALKEDAQALSDESKTSNNEQVTFKDEPEIKPGLTFVPAQINFGLVCVGESKSAKLKVTNTGNCDLNVSSNPLTGTLFQVEGSNTRLAPGSSYTFNVVFSPDTEGTYSKLLSVLYTYSVNNEKRNGLTSAGFSGEGIVCGPVPMDVYINEFNLSYTTIKPCTCATWPACGCGPGTYVFTLMLSVMGDNSVPIPGANVTLHVTGPGNDNTLQVSTDTAGKAQTTFNTSTNNTGKFTVVVTDITGSYNDLDMAYAEELDTVKEASTTTQ